MQAPAIEEMAFSLDSCKSASQKKKEMAISLNSYKSASHQRDDCPPLNTHKHQLSKGICPLTQQL
jgi:hypothetical protein